jgi:hypothetical protein
MAGRIVTWSVGRAARGVPGLRRLPVLKLLAAAEIAMLARDHVMLLTREERRRLIELVRVARGRRQNLSEEERQELEDLVARLEPRILFGEAAERLSPLPLPRRMTHGPRRRG